MLTIKCICYVMAWRCNNAIAIDVVGEIHSKCAYLFFAAYLSPGDNRENNPTRLDHSVFLAIDNFALMSHTHQQMKEKTNIVAEHSAWGEYPWRKEHDLQSELAHYSLSYTGRGSDRRSRPFHVSGQRR